MNEDEPDDGSIPTTITPTASQTPILVVPKTLDSVMSSPTNKSTIPPNVELTLGQYAQTNRSNNPDDKTLPQEPTFFYKEIISSHTRHMIIVVEAPILKDNHHDQDHDDHQPATVGTTSTTSTTTPRPDATNRNKDKGANMLDLSISNNTTGRIVYQTPLTKDVKMAENLNDYADPDEYLWSITRRAAHRAASEGGNVVWSRVNATYINTSLYIMTCTQKGPIHNPYTEMFSDGSRHGRILWNKVPVVCCVTCGVREQQV